MSFATSSSRECLVNPKVSWWSLRSSLERKLLIALVTSVLLCVVLFSLTVVLGAKSHYEPPSVYVRDSGICQTEVCLETANIFKSYMDETAAPCEDFYQFACGSFMKSVNMTGRNTAGPLYTATEQIDVDVQDLLTNPSMIGVELNSTNTAKSLYQKCIEQENDEISGLDFLKRLLEQFLGGWPLADQDWSEERFNWSISLGHIMRELEPDFLFKFGGLPDFFNATKFKIFMVFQSEPVIPLTGFEFFNNFPEKNKLDNLSIYKSTEPLHDLFRDIVCTVNPACGNNTNLNDDIDNLVNATLAIQALLTDVTTFPVDNLTSLNLKEYYGDHFEDYSNTIENMANLFPQVDWMLFFGNIFKDTGYNISANFSIAASRRNIGPILNFLETSSQRTIANFFGLNLLNIYGPLFSPTIKKISGSTETQQKFCLKLVKNNMQYAVAKLYIDRFISKDMLDEIRQMMNEVNIGFGELLKTYDWMDKSTKDMAFKKLNNMLGSVASPDWVFNDTELDLHYSEISNIKSFSFGEAFKAARRCLIRNVAQFYSEPVDRKNFWPVGPLQANAYHLMVTNSMHYQLGILRSPFYKTARPRAINFGSFGYISGHELIHGFDTKGKNFDDIGSLVDWWTNQSLGHFNQQADCLTNQYSQIIEPMTKMHLNGTLTLGENIADNGGIKAAFWVKTFPQFQNEYFRNHAFNLSTILIF